MPPLACSRCFGTCGPASLLPCAAASLPRGRLVRYFLGALVRVGASTRLSGAAKGRRRPVPFFRASGCEALAITLRLAAGSCASITSCARPRTQRKVADESILQAYRSKGCAGLTQRRLCYSAGKAPTPREDADAATHNKQRQQPWSTARQYHQCHSPSRRRYRGPTSRRRYWGTRTTRSTD